MSRSEFGLIRVVIALGLTMIVGWGTVFYAFGVLAPKMIADTGMSRGFVYGCFSLALLTSGLLAPAAGRLIDRRGGRFVMTIGSCVAALGCLLVGWSPNMAVHALAWVVMGAAIPLMLYDPAFATITHLAAGRSRRLIIQITLFGGLASTVFWPLAHMLDAQFGWRMAWVFCAAANLFICAPLHYFILPSSRRDARADGTHPEAAREDKPLVGKSGGAFAFLALATVFASNNFMLSGMSAHMIPLLGSLSLTEAEAVALGAIIGPAQVAGRLAELLFGRNLSPLVIGTAATFGLLLAFGLLAIFGVTGLAGVAFACVYGAANGIITVSRGTLPLALFGRAGYGAVLGRLARPGLAAAAVAPFVFALLIDLAGAETGFEISFAAALLGFGAMLTIWLRFRRT
jgi:hypothetical protein